MYTNSPDDETDCFLLGKRKHEDIDLSPNKRQKQDDKEILDDIELVKDTINSITNSIIKIVNKNEDINKTSELLVEKYLEDAKIFENNNDVKNMILCYYNILKYSNKHNAAAKIGDYYLQKKPYLAIHYYHTERCNGDEFVGCWRLVLFFEYYRDEEMYERMLESCVAKFNYRPAIEKLIQYYITKRNIEKLNYYMNYKN